MIEKFQRILQRMIQSGLLRSSIYVSLSKVFASICNLLFMIYAVNLLSRAENGRFQYYMGFIPLVLAIAEFGLPSAIIKFLSTSTDDKKKIGNVLQASIFIKFISIVILFLMSIVLYYVYREDLLSIFIIVTGGIIVSFVGFFESIFVSFRYYLALSIWNPLTNIIRILSLFFVAASVELPLTYIDILVIFTLSPIFIFILFFLIFPRDKLFWSSENSDSLKKEILEITKFNFWAFLATIFAITSDRLEIFMIHKFHSSDEVAIYGTALQLFSGFVIILSTLTSLVYPRLASQVNTPEFKSTLIKSCFAGSALAFLLLPGFFLAEPILNFIFQNKYQDSIPVFKILYPNYLCQLIFAPLGIALFAMGKPQILAVLALLRLVFGYILDSALIPEFGVIGASTSFFLGQIISWLVLVGYFWASFWR